MAKSKPIDETTAKTIMIAFGLLLVAIGAYFLKLNIYLGSSNVTNLFVAFIVIVAVLLQYFELGLKRYSDISKLKRFGVQQKVTFWISTVILIHTIANLSGLFSVFSTFTGGFLITIGFNIILEAFM